MKDLKLKSYDSLRKLKRYTIDAVAGVYFLFHGDEIVYVGQSKNIHARVQNHKVDKVFDSYTFIKVKNITERNYVESHYIDYFKPKYNIATYDTKELKEFSDKQKEPSVKKNKKLIYALNKLRKEKGYKKGYLYKKYLEKAKYYCRSDLRLICSLLRYNKQWITYKEKQLSKDSRWR